jgi:hypothetical protein
VAQRAGTTRRQTRGEPAARLTRWAPRGVTLLGASAAPDGQFASQSRPAAALPPAESSPMADVEQVQPDRQYAPPAGLEGDR